MSDEIDAARAIIAERLERFPDSPFFLFAKAEMDRIDQRLQSGKPVDWPFYDSLRIGLMCARELETVDMPFCDSIYAMLGKIRPPEK